MKKFLVTTARFAALCLIAYVSLIVVVGEYGPMLLKKNIRYVKNDIQRQKYHDLKNTTDIDILFLGSSHVQRGFDPRVFSEAGLKTFNLGTNSQTPINTKALIMEYLDQLDPKIVVLEVNVVQRSSDGVEAAVVLISNYRNYTNSIKMITAHNNFLLFNTFIFALYKDLTSPFIEQKQEERKNNVDNYIKGGFVEREITNYTANSKDKELVDQHFNWAKKNAESPQSEALINVIELIESRNIRLILVQMPVTKYWHMLDLNSKVFDEEMSGYAEYYNFSNLTTLNDSLHFYDSHHLNQQGVIRFNKFFIDTLKLDQSLNQQDLFTQFRGPILPSRGSD